MPSPSKVVIGLAKRRVIEEMSFGFSVVKYLKRFKFDIVHANTAFIGYIMSRKMTGSGVFVYTCHNPLWPEEKVHFGEKIVRYFEGAAMRGATSVIALNKTMKKAIMTRARVKPERVFVVPNGVDVDFFRPNLDCEQTVKKYGLEGKKVVLFVGRVTPSKGVHVLFEAVKSLREVYDIRDVKMLVVGPLSGFFGDDNPTNYVKDLYGTLPKIRIFRPCALFI